MNIIIAYNPASPQEKAAARILDAILAKLMPKGPRAEGPLDDQHVIVYYSQGGELLADRETAPVC